MGRAPTEQSLSESDKLNQEIAISHEDSRGSVSGLWQLPGRLLAATVFVVTVVLLTTGSIAYYNMERMGRNDGESLAMTTSALLAERIAREIQGNYSAAQRLAAVARIAPDRFEQMAEATLSEHPLLRGIALVRENQPPTVIPSGLALPVLPQAADRGISIVTEGQWLMLVSADGRNSMPAVAIWSRLIALREVLDIGSLPRIGRLTLRANGRILFTLGDDGQTVTSDSHDNGKEVHYTVPIEGSDWILDYRINRDELAGDLPSLRRLLIGSGVAALWLSVWLLHLISRASRHRKTVTTGSNEDRLFSGDEQRDCENIEPKQYEEESIGTIGLHLQSMITNDPVTHTYNRRHFLTLLDQEVAKAQRQHLELACVILDIDRFQSLQEQLDPPVGEKVLSEVAGHIQASIRNYDIVARFGHEEFAILLPFTGLVDAMSVAERIRDRIASHPLASTPFTVTLTVSIGVAMFDQEAEEPARQLIDSAVRGLELAKARGHNRVATTNAGGRIWNEESSN
jgi:diguanylate cyclase (GGDEF)-like protein